MERKSAGSSAGDHRDASSRGVAGRAGHDMTRKKPLPPSKTHAEEFYFVKQMNNRTPMLIIMADGEELRGHVEWYDDACIKVHRDDAPNLLIYKRYIKMILKAPEA